MSTSELVGSFTKSLISSRSFRRSGEFALYLELVDDIFWENWFYLKRIQVVDEFLALEQFHFPLGFRSLYKEPLVLDSVYQEAMKLMFEYRCDLIHKALWVIEELLESGRFQQDTDEGRARVSSVSFCR